MPDPGGAGPLRLERSGPVVMLAIDRPEKLNAIDRAVRRALIAALDELAADPEVRVVILRGAGERAFSAGSDISGFPDQSPLEAFRSLREHDAYTAVERFPKPVIAMIDGYCLGGGCELACVCDLRIASDRARFGQPEIDLGLIPGVGGTQYLPRLIGQGRALRLILTGETIDARRALEIGLVDEVVPHPELEGRTRALAAVIVEKPIDAPEAARASVRAAWRLSLDGGLEVERGLAALCRPRGPGAEADDRTGAGR